MKYLFKCQLAKRIMNISNLSKYCLINFSPRYDIALHLGQLICHCLLQQALQHKRCILESCFILMCAINSPKGKCPFLPHMVSLSEYVSFFNLQNIDMLDTKWPYHACKSFFTMVARKALSPVLPMLCSYLSVVACAVQLKALLSAPHSM